MRKRLAPMFNLFVSPSRRGRLILALNLFLCSQLILNVTQAPSSIAQAASGPALLVNVAANRLAINPGVYGVTFFWDTDANTKTAQIAYANSIKLPLNRSGGDATTRYNWQVDSSNAGIDWYYMGGNGQSSSTPGASTDSFIDINRSIGSKSVLTVPTIQYINKFSQWHCSFPRSIYGAQQSFNPYVHPNGDDCGNGVTTAGQNITDTHVSNHDIPNTPAIQQAWVNHLKVKYGPAAGTGIIYQLDNEPHNWGYMHRDVHPGAVSEDEVIQQNITYASAIKASDPTAWVAGPSEIQFAWYFEFAPDPYQQNPAGQANNIQYLQAMKQYEQTQGTRIIDSFDVHYPDANDNHYPALTDIDRLKAVVDQYYDGTKISVSEWTGGDGLSGALFTADELGIYGRDDLAFASYWGMDINSPSAYAYKMYRNYDGSGSGFGETSVQASSADAGKLAVHAAQRTSDGTVTLMVVNKTGGDLTSSLALSGFNPTLNAKIYRFSGANLNQIVQQPDLTIGSSAFSATYPANSITLLVLPKAPANPPLPMFKAGPVQSGNIFWVGATKPSTTRQNSFSVTNTGATGSTLSVNLPGSPLTGPDASKFSLLNSADFPLALGANQGHAVSLSCTPPATGPLNATLSLTTNDHNQPGTNFSFILKCSGGYVVTVAADDGSLNTLSQVLSAQAVSPGDGVVFDLPAGSNNHITLNAVTASNLVVKPGVQIDGGCTTGPPIIVDGGNKPGSFKLSGGNLLRGLEIKGFSGPGPQLLTIGTGTGNYLECARIHK